VETEASAHVKKGQSSAANGTHAQTVERPQNYRRLTETERSRRVRKFSASNSASTEQSEKSEDNMTEHVDLKAARERWLIPNKPVPTKSITSFGVVKAGPREEYQEAVIGYRARIVEQERYRISMMGMGEVNHTDTNTIIREAK
jgi:hypothetical protein